MPSLLVTQATPPTRTVLQAAGFSSGTATSETAVYGTGAGIFGTVGSGAARAYDPATGLWGTTLTPNAGADQNVNLQGSNGMQGILTAALGILQTGVDPLPGVKWSLTMRRAVLPNLVPNAAGVDSWVSFGLWLDSFGVLFSRPRGWGVILNAMGDQGPNWRVYAQDGPLGSGGSVVLNADTGVAFTPAAVQTLELRVGSDGSSPFFRFLIDGATVFEPTLPQALGLPASGTVFPVLAAMRGADAADTVAPVWVDPVGPAIFLDETPS